MTIRTKIDELTKETFEEVQRIEQSLRDAEKNRKETPVKNGMGAAYNAKAQAAETKYREALEEYKQMRFHLPDAAMRKMDQLRKEYTSELEEKHRIDPAKLDFAALELMKSGIMRPADYKAMLESAQRVGNDTMTRMISKYAREAADAIEKRNGPNDPDAQALRYVHYAGRNDPVEASLQNFDQIADAFRRCVNNPALIPRWEELEGAVLEQL